MKEQQTSDGRDSRPRHCMVVYAYYPLAETRVQREAETLVHAGYVVDVICLGKPGEPTRERYRGVDVHRLPVQLERRSIARQLLNYLRFLARAAARLTRLHLRHRYGTVQVHNLPDFLVFCALVPKLQGVPVILDLHDLMPEFFEGRFGPDRRRWLQRLIRWQERLSCRFADHVLTVSEHWRETLISRGVPAERCSVVMNVADERVFTRRPRTPTHDGHFQLLYHGTVTHRYGLDLAIRAVDLLRDELPELQLTVLGRGDDVPTLLELRRELGLEARVDIRNEIVLAEHLPAVISAADLGVVPYRNDVFTDGLLPTKLMEYAVMGIPCVAARTTAIEAHFRDTMVEFFEPGSAVDLARSIRELYESPRRRAQLSRASERFTRRHSWARVGAAYVELVGRLSCTAPPRSGPGVDSRTTPDVSRRPVSSVVRRRRPASTARPPPSMGRPL